MAKTIQLSRNAELGKCCRRRPILKPVWTGSRPQRHNRAANRTRRSDWAEILVPALNGPHNSKPWTVSLRRFLRGAYLSGTGSAAADNSSVWIRFVPLAGCNSNPTGLRLRPKAQEEITHDGLVLLGIMVPQSHVHGPRIDVVFNHVRACLGQVLADRDRN